MSRLRSAIDARDVVALIGVLLIAGGLAMVSAAAALVVPGLLLFLLAVLPALVSRDRGGD